MAIEHKDTIEELVVRKLVGGNVRSGVIYLASLLDGLLRLQDVSVEDVNSAVAANRADAIAERDANRKESEFNRIAAEQASRIVEAARSAAQLSKKAKDDAEREQIRKDAIAVGIEMATKQLETLFVK